VVFGEVEELNHRGVVHEGEDARLADEELAEVGVLRVLGAQTLEPDETTEPARAVKLGAPELREGPFTNGREELVASPDERGVGVSARRHVSRSNTNPRAWTPP